jgi:hypothetical protein
VLVSNKIHPFFVQLPEGTIAPPSSEGHSYNGDVARGAWVDASNLKAGYRLLNDDGSWATVTGLTVETTPLTAYNMKVEGYHTYFVTGSVDANPVWVHNDCFGDQLFEALGVDSRAFHRDIKPAILQDFAADLRRRNVRNPDVGIDDAGNIIFRDPRTRRVIVRTNVPASSYGGN